MAMKIDGGYIVSTIDGGSATIDNEEAFEIFQEVEQTFTMEDIRLVLEEKGIEDVCDEKLRDICEDYLDAQGDNDSWRYVLEYIIERHFRKMGE